MTYNFLVGIVRVLMRLVFRISVQGSENIPSTGAIIICANHIHNLDPALIAICSPRPIRFMAKAEAFEWPILGYLIKKVGAFPVKRGGSDISAIRTSLAKLREGEILGIFPEGTRSKTGELRQAHQGVAMIADTAKAPLLPVGISGTYRPFRRLRISFGQPVLLHELIPIGEQYSRELASAQLMLRIDALRKSHS